MRNDRNNFDALRLLGALFVLVNHSMELTGDHPFGFAGQGVSTLGVKMFFAMSGFLITISWVRDPHPGRFISRRARRIMPALAVMVIVSALIIGPIFTTLELPAYAAHPLFMRYLGNLVFYVSYALPGVFANNPLAYATNGSLWTLPVEVVMYALVPLLVLATKRHAILLGLLFSVSFSLSMIFYLRHPTPLVVLGTEFWTAATLAPYFVVGSAIASLRLTHFLDWRIGVLGILLLHWNLAAVGPWAEAVLVLILPYAVLAVGLQAWPVIASAGRFGDWSYGLYLWAFPIQQMVVSATGTGGGGWRNASLALPATLLMAALSWHLVERRALGRAAGDRKPIAQPSSRPITRAV